MIVVAALALTFQLFTGPVVGVADGDTITVMRERQPVTVRLAEIDCPEKHQPYGTKAKQFTSMHVFKKEVTVQPVSIDRYGRTVAHVHYWYTTSRPGIQAGSYRDLGLELVEAGLAWWYSQYSHDASIAQAQAEAYRERRGLWADPHPIAPWEWRR